MTRERRHPFTRALIRRLASILTILIAFTVLQVVAVRFLNPPFTPLMVYRWFQGEQLAYQWRSLGDISPLLQQAVMSSEDQRFPHHHGFDWREIRRAIQENRQRGRHRGASTITMQVAKNLYLWHGYSWLRKALEAYYTVLIELLWPKWRIMEVYLNIAEWGPGVFGAEAASRIYFRRSSAALSKKQAALMAAVLPNPLRWSPADPTQYIKKRQATILRQMDQVSPIRRNSAKR